MDSLRHLEEIFAKFPGIGPRQAKRFVYYLLNKSSASVEELAHLIKEVKKSTSECGQCHRFFAHNSNYKSISSTAKSLISDSCSICSDKSRDQSTLMVVARDSDFETVEKSGSFTGLYFILGGTVPVLDKEPEKRIRIKKLLEYVSNSENIKEIILSLNATPDGDHTENIVKEGIHKILKNKNVKISVLGRGLSTGSELEYVDRETIKSALQNRK